MAGLSFRRLLGPAGAKSKEKDLDWPENWDTDESRSTRVVRKKKRSRSWIPTTRRRRSSSTETCDPRKIRSNHRVEISLPQISFPQPFSSTCSLLPSQETQKHAFAGTSSSDTKAASSLCLPEQIQRHRRSMPPTRPPRPINGLDSSPNWGLSFTQTRPRSFVSLSTPRISQSDDQSTHSLTDSNKEASTGSVKTVDHLISKTDETFKAFGIALKDVLPNAQTNENLKNSSLPAPLSISRRHPAPMPLALRYKKEARSRDIPSPLASPARTASVMKPKRKKGTRRLPLNGPHPRRPQMRNLRGWVLPENLTDILTGQRFKRIEADEMLSPERLEQMKRRREQVQQEEDAQKKLEIEAQEKILELCEAGHKKISETPETPLEPFHLEDLPLRITASGVEVDTILEEPSPCSPIEEEITCQDFIIEEDSSEDKIYLKPLTYLAGYEAKPREAPTTPIPLPPPKDAAKCGKPLLEKPLPLTPKITLTAPENKESKLLAKRRRRARQVRRLLQAEEKDGLLYLHSTPFTLTNPLFRHGPIVISKTEISQGVKVIDDTLDWTAFQMAILCGAGDLFPDLTWEEDVKQVEDITTWFDSFGFDTCGKLVSEEVPVLSSAESSKSATSLSLSTVDMDSELPIPVDSEYPYGFWNSSSPSSSYERKKFFNKQGLRRWTGEGHPKPYTQRNSFDSGPPSPMMPIIIRSGSADGDDPVPMGYNLNHDLGEFLRWEAENAYANGYCRSP